MSNTFNNRSTEALNIHKRFSTLELSSKADSSTNQWNRAQAARVKGGMLVQGTIHGNCLTEEGNLIVNGNLTVAGLIHGNIIGSYTIDNYQYMGMYDGNVKGNFVAENDIIVLKNLNIKNPSIFTPYLGNCITNECGTSIACANNNDTISFVNNKQLIAKMNQNSSWQTNKGTATGDYAYAEGFSYANGVFSHSEGVNTIAEDNCHVEGGNNITQVQGPAYVEGFGNRVTIGGAALSPPYVNVDACHIEGINNRLQSDTTYNHLQGESSNVILSTATFVSGFGHTASLCSEVHIEGHTNTAFKLNNSHIEGTNNMAGNISLSTSQSIHIEGENNEISQGTLVHLEGTNNATLDKNVTYTMAWAGGRNARIKQSNEWVRSSGFINESGDAQTGIYTLHRTQLDATPRALGMNTVLPAGTPNGLLVLDGHTHLYDISIAGRTNDNPGDYYTCDLLVIVKRELGVYTIDTHKINENINGHFIGKPNLVSVGTTGVTAGTFSLLMNGTPGSLEIYWTASAISTQVA
jgi:hypothetical protein